MKLLAGTSGYAFKEWKRVFYPEELADDGMLGYYASRFSAVEINNTFYRLPKEHVLQEWAAQVPDGFTFAIKAIQRITHHARIKPEAAGAPSVDISSQVIFDPDSGDRRLNLTGGSGCFGLVVEAGVVVGELLSAKFGGLLIRGSHLPCGHDHVRHGPVLFHQGVLE